MTVQEESTVRLGGLPDSETCWALLERVAASGQLKRSARLQELLFYIGKRYLKDGCDRVHEQEIGAQVFKRPESYDTAFDNIVRTNVSDLRKRIEAYFQGEGASEPLIVEIPRGGYTPVFRRRAREAESAPTPPAEIPARTGQPNEVAAQPLPAATHRSWMPAALVVSGALAAAFAIGCLLLWSQLSALRHSLFAWQARPSVAAFWSELLNANPDTDIVVSDTGIGMVQALSQQTFPLDQYLSHSYVGQLQSENFSPDMHAALNRIMAWNLASPDEFSLARRILALDPLGKKIHLYNARNYMPDLIKRDNVILIGARKSNPWDELFDNRLNFITEFDSPRVVNRVPAAGEQLVYPTSASVGYCVVAYLPKTDQTGMVLLIEGTNAEATEAAGDFLLSEDQLSGFKRMLHVAKLPYFQVLLKVSSVRGTPFTATVQAYRVFPNMH
jgi:hypothetical protein